MTKCILQVKLISTLQDTVDAVRNLARQVRDDIGLASMGPVELEVQGKWLTFTAASIGQCFIAYGK